MSTTSPHRLGTANAVDSTAAMSSDLRGLGQFARMADSSIAGHAAIAWVTHFLNAAYSGVPPERRDLESLRLVWAVLTTYWHQLGTNPLTAGDAPRFHRSFRRSRSPTGSRYPRGLLDPEQLADGARRLLGDWFRPARNDPDRIGWGVVFEHQRERAGYHPELRLRHAPLGPLTPPAAPPAEQTWHTYRPVPIPGADDVIAVLEATEMWPHFATDIGRFTALRGGRLDGQIFEIEAMAEIARHLPMLTRCYVTVTRVLDRSQPGALKNQIAALSAHLSRLGREEPSLLPPGATPLHVTELTAHAGHFLGRARNYFVLFETREGAYLRAVGNWDPMPWYVRLAYTYEGAAAQRAFWCFETPEHSMLRQFARAAARRQRVRGEAPKFPPEL
jgi:hypothetical protein